MVNPQQRQGSELREMFDGGTGVSEVEFISGALVRCSNCQYLGGRLIERLSSDGCNRGISVE